MKRLFLLIFLLTLFIPMTLASDWPQLGYNLRQNYVYPLSLLFAFSSNFTNVSKVNASTTSTFGSDYSPLISDFDLDGNNEIVSIKNHSIRVSKGVNYTQKGVIFTDPRLTPSGQFIAADFDDDGRTDLVLVTNTGSEYSLWIMDFDGNNWTVIKSIDGVQSSNGLTCSNIYNDGILRCMYVGLNAGLYIYSNSDVTPVSPTLIVAGAISTCVNYSIPYLIDYNDDGLMDLYIPTQNNCLILEQWKNTGSDFTLQGSFNLPQPLRAVAKANLDGPPKELVIVTSNNCLTANSDACWWHDYSKISVYNIDDNTLKCQTTDAFQHSIIICGGYCNTYKGVTYLDGLMTCETDGTGCDVNLDGYNEVIFTEAGYGLYGWDSIDYLNKTCAITTKRIYNSDVNGIGAVGAINDYKYIHGIWADWDFDNEFEYMRNGIFHINGSQEGNNTLSLNSVNAIGAYFILGELNNDSLFDVVWQQSNKEINVFTPKSRVFITNESAANLSTCQDTDGDDPFTYGAVYYGAFSFTDVCSGADTLIEYICDSPTAPNQKEYTCSSYGAGFSCSVGKCTQETPITCNYPTLFCDDFNYDYALVLKGWSPQTVGGSYLTSLTPINFQLFLNLSIVENIYHETNVFPQHYYQSPTTTISEGYTSPLFSSEFSLGIRNDSVSTVSECFRYIAFDPGDQEVYDIAFCPNSSVYYLDNTSRYQSLCAACFNPLSFYTLKINTEFSQKPGFNFNSSYTSDRVHVIIGQIDYIINGFVDKKAYALQKYSLLKSDVITATIDDYYVMVGSDTDTDTSYSHLTQIYTPVNISITPSGGGSGDLYDVVSSFWVTIGLKSAASRTLFALIVMVGFAGLYIIISMAWQITPSPIILIVMEMFLLIMFVYLGLIAIWIIIVLGLLLVIVAMITLIMKGRG